MTRFDLTTLCAGANNVSGGSYSLFQMENGVPRSHGRRPAGDTSFRRLAAVIRDVELDCECRARLDAALARFAALEGRRSARAHLADARRQRERIEAILAFLKDLDELVATEADRSVFAEIAVLFDDVAAAAAEGSRALQLLAELPPEPPHADAGKPSEARVLKPRPHPTA